MFRLTYANPDIEKYGREGGVWATHPTPKQLNRPQIPQSKKSKRVRRKSKVVRKSEPDAPMKTQKLDYEIKCKTIKNSLTFLVVCDTVVLKIASIELKSDTGK
jgi:hypothetical protein